MSQDFAEKPARRLSKFSNAGEDRFARAADPYAQGEPAPLPAPGPAATADTAAERLEALAGMVETLMTEPDSAPRSGPRFSRFSHEERFRPLPDIPPHPQGNARFSSPGDDPLSDVLDQDGENPHRRARTPPSPRGTVDESAHRLLTELEDIRNRPPVFVPQTGARQTANGHETPHQAPPLDEISANAPREPEVKRVSRRNWRRLLPPAPPLGSVLRRAKPGAQTRHRVAATLQGARALGQKGGHSAGRAARRGLQLLPAAVRVLRAKKISARYRMALATLHTRLLDRRFERLLFVRTDLTSTADPDAAAKDYHYNGPIPKAVFAWALSALPEDLKAFAFVDFRAGNGRTMLLAARRNFEAIQGYTYNAQSYDDLELNIAQYPRSLMTCRNLRAIRGDVEGVSIPDQPCVLFVPNSRRERHLGIILNHVAASFRLNPRPIYLIFDNADPSVTPGHDDIFEPAPLPLPQRIRVALASPSQVKVYKSVLVRTPA